MFLVRHMYHVFFYCMSQAYQVLRHGGLSDDRIIVMHADDIAENMQNPHAGQIFNKPGGPNVYVKVPKVCVQ